MAGGSQTGLHRIMEGQERRKNLRSFCLRRRKKGFGKSHKGQDAQNGLGCCQPPEIARNACFWDGNEDEQDADQNTCQVMEKYAACFSQTV